MGSFVFSLEELQSSLQLLLLRQKPLGQNIIDDGMKLPELFKSHALERLPFHESPRLTCREG